MNPAHFTSETGRTARYIRAELETVEDTETCYQCGEGKTYRSDAWCVECREAYAESIGLTKGRDHVPNEDIRAAVERSGISWCHLARQLGVMRTSRCKPSRVLASGEHRRYHSNARFEAGDGQYVKRALGAKTYNTRGKTYRQETIDYGMACRIAEIIGLDPVDVGL